MKWSHIFFAHQRVFWKLALLKTHVQDFVSNANYSVVEVVGDIFTYIQLVDRFLCHSKIATFKITLEHDTLE